MLFFLNDLTRNVSLTVERQELQSQLSEHKNQIALSQAACDQLESDLQNQKQTSDRGH